MKFHHHPDLSVLQMSYLSVATPKTTLQQKTGQLCRRDTAIVSDKRDLQNCLIGFVELKTAASKRSRRILTRKLLVITVGLADKLYGMIYFISRELIELDPATQTVGDKHFRVQAFYFGDQSTGCFNR